MARRMDHSFSKKSTGLPRASVPRAVVEVRLSASKGLGLSTTQRTKRQGRLSMISSAPYSFLRR